VFVIRSPFVPACAAAATTEVDPVPGVPFHELSEPDSNPSEKTTLE